MGVSVAAISRALKNGRLPYVERTRRGYLIDPSLLFEVFRGRRMARVVANSGGSEELAELMREVVALRVANAKFESDLRNLHPVLDAERLRASAAERDRDGWRVLCEWLVMEKPQEAG